VAAVVAVVAVLQVEVEVTRHEFTQVRDGMLFLPPSDDHSLRCCALVWNDKHQPKPPGEKQNWCVSSGLVATHLLHCDGVPYTVTVPPWHCRRTRRQVISGLSSTPGTPGKCCCTNSRNREQTLQRPSHLGVASGEEKTNRQTNNTHRRWV